MSDSQKTFLKDLGGFRARLQAIKAHCDFNYSDRPDNSSQHVGEIIKDFDDIMDKYATSTPSNEDKKNEGAKND